MNDYTNGATVGLYTNDSVMIRMRGPLMEYVEGLRRYLLGAPGVKSAALLEGRPILVATCQLGLPAPNDDPEQIRVRIRNRCQDWFRDVTGTNYDCVNLVAKPARVLPPETIIDRLGLEHRTRTILIGHKGLNTISDVMEYAQTHDFLDIRQFGPKSLNDLREKLAVAGYDLPF